MLNGYSLNVFFIIYFYYPFRKHPCSKAILLLKGWDFILRGNMSAKSKKVAGPHSYNEKFYCQNFKALFSEKNHNYSVLEENFIIVSVEISQTQTGNPWYCWCGERSLHPVLPHYQGSLPGSGSDWLHRSQPEPENNSAFMSWKKFWVKMKSSELSGLGSDQVAASWTQDPGVCTFDKTIQARLQQP